MILRCGLFAKIFIFFSVHITAYSRQHTYLYMNTEYNLRVTLVNQLIN